MLLAPVFEVMIGEVHHGVPVVAGDLVFAGAKVVADGALDQLAGGGPGHLGDGARGGRQRRRHNGRVYHLQHGIGGQIFGVLEEAEPADRITLVPIAISDSW